MSNLKKDGLYAAYLRKSRQDIEAEQKGRGETLARHKAILTDTAQRLGITIVQYYREVVSGDTLAGRPQMQQLLNDVNAGSWAGVLVVDIDRLGRGDSVDQGIIFQSFLYSNTLIVTPDKIYDPQDDSDAEFFEIKLFFSRREYTMIKKRMQRGRLQSAMAGCYMGARPPFGYERIKLQRRKGWSLQPVPEKAATVRMVFEWYLHGMNGKSVGGGAIADALNQMGIKTDLGNQWSHSAIQAMLHDPVYIGKVKWNQKRTTVVIRDGIRTKKRTKSDNPLLIDGLHEGIIPVEDWEQVQKKMNSKFVSTTPKQLELKNPFVGLIYCSECGKPMSRLYDPRRKVDFLRCVTLHCSTSSAPLPVVEDAVLATLKEWVDAYEAQPQKPTEARQTNPNADMIKQLTDQHKTVEGQLNKLYDLLEQGLYTADLFRKRKAELTARAQSIDEAIAGLTVPDEPDNADFIPHVRTVIDAYSAASPVEKNNLLKLVIAKIIYHKTQRCLKNNQPGDYLTLDILPVTNKV